MTGAGRVSTESRKCRSSRVAESIAVAMGALSSYVGLKWGRWMTRVRR